MFIYVKVENSAIKGSVVIYSETEGLYVKANSTLGLFGVVRDDPVANAEGNFIAPVVFRGYVEAKCSQDIPAQGGIINVLNGEIYIDNSNSCISFIPPRPLEIDEASQTESISNQCSAGDLVRILVR